MEFNTSKNVKVKSSIIVLMTFFMSFFFQSCLRNDDTPPILESLKIKKVETINGKTIKVKFSKDLNLKIANNINNHIVTYTNKDDLVEKILPKKVTTAGNEITIVLKQELLDGGYHYYKCKELKSKDGSYLNFDNSFYFKYLSPNKWISITNLKVPLSITGVPLLYSLQEQKVVELSNAQSTAWDLAFRFDNAFMFIFPNEENGGVISSTDTPLTSVLKGEDFIIENAKAGLTADVGFPIGAYGTWCKREGGNPSDYTKPFKVLDKTIVFKTALGKYGKMKIKSIYKNTPIIPMPRDFDDYYISFEYVIQKDASDNLDISK